MLLQVWLIRLNLFLGNVGPSVWNVPWHLCACFGLMFFLSTAEASFLPRLEVPFTLRGDSGLQLTEATLNHISSQIFSEIARQEVTYPAATHSASGVLGLHFAAWNRSRGKSAALSDTHDIFIIQNLHLLIELGTDICLQFSIHFSVWNQI